MFIEHSTIILSFLLSLTDSASAGPILVEEIAVNVVRSTGEIEEPSANVSRKLVLHAAVASADLKSHSEHYLERSHAKWHFLLGPFILTARNFLFHWISWYFVFGNININSNNVCC